MDMIIYIVDGDPLLPVFVIASVINNDGHPYCRN